MGARHVDYGVKPEDYSVFGECLIEAIAYVSGASWNDTLQEAWIDAYDELRWMMLDVEARPPRATGPDSPA